MKKFIRSLVVSLVVLFLLFIGALYVVSLKAPEYASKKLSSKLKVPSKIDDISVSLNQITVTKLEIQNLPKSVLPKALSIETSSCKNNLFNYLSNDISIEEISLENIYLGLEFDSPKGTDGNWTVLMNNLKETSTPTDKKDSSSVTIKELSLINIQVEVAYKSSGVKKKLPVIPKIVLHNINTSEGLTEEQIMQSVLGQMLKSVFIQENLKNMFESFLDQPQDTIDSIVKPFKGLF